MKHLICVGVVLGIIGFMTVSAVQAQTSIFFDFDCDSPDCEGVAPLECFWEVSDTGIVSNVRLGANPGEIINFNCKIGPKVFYISDFSEPFSGKTIIISDDGSYLEGLYQGFPANTISFSKVENNLKIAEVIMHNQLTEPTRYITCLRAGCGDINGRIVPGRWLRRGKTVALDIKPGSDPNCININGHGVIPVAILGSSDFDVTDIDTSTLSFAGLDVQVRGNKGPLCHLENVDGDLYLDLVCQFEDDPVKWKAGNDTANLTGKLLDGTPIQGTDSICVIP